MTTDTPDTRLGATEAVTSPYPHLFAPLKLRGRSFQSRIVMTAHTISLAEDGIPGPRMREYYRERAAGGTGMIVVEPVPAHATARHGAANFTSDDRIIEPMRELGETVREHGTVMVGQVYNLGSFVNTVVSTRETWAPCADRRGRMRHPSHAVTRAEIREMIDGFVAVARRLAVADLDGVEINMAYDGFIDSFFSPLRNNRTDEYGGALANRLRIAREVLARCREAIGTERILGITITGDHLQPEHLHIDDAAEIAVALTETCELDYIAVANADQVMNHFLIPGMDVERGYGVQWARAVKHAVPDVVITAQGRISSPEVAESALRERAADLVGMARALIADPELPNKCRTGEEELCLCVACNQSCLGRRRHNVPMHCLQNGAAGRETTLGRRRRSVARPARRVTVVGGGPAGLEAARICAEGGHSVVLLEREPYLGGQARLASQMPYAGEFAAVYNYRERALRRLGSEIRLGVKPTVETITGLRPDTVILATGSQPSDDIFQLSLGQPVEIDPTVADRVYAAAHVVAGEPVLGASVLVVDGDGHRRALGTAELLAERGHSVSIVSEDVSIGVELASSGALAPTMQRLAALNVRLVPWTSLLRFGQDGAQLRSLYDCSEWTIAVDAVVSATQHVSDDALRLPLEDAGLTVRVIGDARAPRYMDNAVFEGLEAGMSIA